MLNLSYVFVITVKSSRLTTGTSMLWVDGQISSSFLPLKISIPTMWTLACPCLPVLEVDISTILQGLPCCKMKKSYIIENTSTSSLIPWAWQNRSCEGLSIAWGRWRRHQNLQTQTECLRALPFSSWCGNGYRDNCETWKDVDIVKSVLMNVQHSAKTIQSTKWI